MPCTCMCWVPLFAAEGRRWKPRREDTTRTREKRCYWGDIFRSKLVLCYHLLGRWVGGNFKVSIPQRANRPQLVPSPCD